MSDETEQEQAQAPAQPVVMEEIRASSTPRMLQVRVLVQAPSGYGFTKSAFIGTIGRTVGYGPQRGKLIWMDLIEDGRQVWLTLELDVAAAPSDSLGRKIWSLVSELKP